MALWVTGTDAVDPADVSFARVRGCAVRCARCAVLGCSVARFAVRGLAFAGFVRKSRSHRQRRHRGWQQTRISRSRNLRSLNQHPELIPPHSTKRRRARSGGCQSRCQARLSPHEQPKPQAIASHQFRSVRKRIGEPSELLKQPPHCQGDGSAGRGRRAQRLRQNFRQFPYRTEIVRVERESVHFVGQLTLLAPGPLTRLQCLACR